MPLAGFPEKQYVRRNLFTFALAVPASPASVPISSDTNLVNNYVDSFFVSVPAGGVNVFIGPAGVIAATGLEIIAGGGPANFLIEQGGRQQYEIQSPLLALAAVAKCDIADVAMIPFQVWDLSQLFLTGVGAQAVVIGFSPNSFV